MKKLYLDESQILSTIESVLTENRKVLKVNNGGNNMPPQQMPSMPQDPMMADPNASMLPNTNLDANNMDEMPPLDNGNEGEQNTNSQFDTNFDAGVEADEDSDPKHYIQQLTGKLSQSLNSFNNEQGGDSGLNKYVASMIIAASCKNLDDKAKKELIEKINSASSEPEEELTSDTEEESNDDTFSMDDMEQTSQEEIPPMNERVFSKRDILKEHMTVSKLMELTNAMGYQEDRPEEKIPDLKKKTPHAWTSKY